MKKKALLLKEVKGQQTLIHYRDLADSLHLSWYVKASVPQCKTVLLLDEMEQNKENSVYFSALVTDDYLRLGPKKPSKQQQQTHRSGIVMELPLFRYLLSLRIALYS